MGRDDVQFALSGSFKFWILLAGVVTSKAVTDTDTKYGVFLQVLYLFKAQLQTCRDVSSTGTLHDNSKAGHPWSFILCPTFYQTCLAVSEPELALWSTFTSVLNYGVQVYELLFSIRLSATLYTAVVSPFLAFHLHQMQPQIQWIDLFSLLKTCSSRSAPITFEG